MNLDTIFHALTPWEASPTLVIIFILSGILFWRGSRRMHLNRARRTLFWLGFVLLYLSLHTQLDYYAERAFFMHRVQHVVLHHLGPLLLMAAYPGQVMLRGLPFTWRWHWRYLGRTRWGRAFLILIRQRYIVPFIFVFLVLIWLVPKIQFYAMLDWRWYRFMNWSVVVSGFLYWNIILDRRPYIPPIIDAKTRLGRFWQWFFKEGHPATMSIRGRIISPIVTMLPQMIAGIWLVLTTTNLYPLFELCGRAVSVSPLQDQGIGGFIMWIPAALVETFGILISLANYIALSGKGRLARAARYHQSPSTPTVPD